MSNNFFHAQNRNLESVLSSDFWSGFKCQQKAPTTFIPISTPEELQNINNIDNPNNYPYLLTNDIDFSGYVDNDGNPIWNPINGFSGSLFGQGYYLKNFADIHINGTSIALFTSLKGTIKDVNLDNMHISAIGVNYMYMGILVSETTVHSLIENCHISNSSVTGNSGNYTAVGGMVGILTGTMRYCSAYNVSVKGYYVSGILCGDIAGSTYEGNKGIAEDCVAIGKVTMYAGGWYAGLLCGRLALGNARITRCIAGGIVTMGTARNGGAFGDAYVNNSSGISINNSVALGSVVITTSRPADIGRINSGKTVHSISNCYSSDLVNIGRIPVSSSSGRDGETVDDSSTKSQSFYEGLGYDFNGTWTMGKDSYPMITKSFTTFGGFNANTGYAAALFLETNGIKISVLDYINDEFKAISESLYLMSSTEYIQNRCKALLNRMSIQGTENQSLFLSSECTV